MTETEELIKDLKQLGKYSKLEPNYYLLAAEKIAELSGKQIKTNYDRIRNMSVVELAEFMAEQVMKQEINHLIKENPNITATHIEFLKQTLFRGYLRYLESEVDNNA